MPTKGKIIFKATNKQRKQKGKPPVLDTTDPSRYCAYFESDFGEQLIFSYDYQTRLGTLWFSQKGWEHPFQVVDGKAQGAGLSRDEKNWLKTCWNIVTAVQGRRDHHQKMLTGVKEELIAPISPSYDEVHSGMEHLYDYLIGTDFAPNCSRSEFAHGWASFIQFMAKLEAKYKSQIEVDKGN